MTDQDAKMTQLLRLLSELSMINHPKPKRQTEKYCVMAEGDARHLLKSDPACTRQEGQETRPGHQFGNGHQGERMRRSGRCGGWVAR
jgi:hypothetical protein